MMKRSLGRLLPGELKRRIRRTPVYVRWLAREVPKAPGMEFYARGQDNLNRRSHAEAQALAKASGMHPLSPYFARQVPKTLWMYWGQGEANAPHVVRRCIESWRHHNPDWEIRVLDAQSVGDFVNMSDFPKHLAQRFFANLLRLRLLKAHGGVWADATVYCHRPLDGWLPLMAASGYFCLERPGPDRWFSSWFLAAEKNHVLTCAWEEAYGAYLRSLKAKPDKYFMFFYSFQWRLKSDPMAFAAWQRRSGLAAPPTFLLMEAIKGKIPLERATEMIAIGLPVSKLSWKAKVDPAAIDKLLDDLPGSGPA